MRSMRSMSSAARWRSIPTCRRSTNWSSRWPRRSTVAISSGAAPIPRFIQSAPGMILVLVAFVAAVFGGLAAYSAYGVRGVERAHPPGGRFVEVAGGRLHLLELGPADAPAVVLLHGASGNLADMRVALGDRLAAAHRVILVDRPGHGWSDRPDGPADASPARQAALIHQALERIGVTRAILVGHSW